MENMWKRGRRDMKKSETSEYSFYTVFIFVDVTKLQILI